MWKVQPSEQAPALLEDLGLHKLHAIYLVLLNDHVLSTLLLCLSHQLPSQEPLVALLSCSGDVRYALLSLAHRRLCITCVHCPGTW